MMLERKCWRKWVPANPLTFRDPEGLDVSWGGCGGGGWGWASGLVGFISNAASSLANSIANGIRAAASAAASAASAVSSAVSSAAGAIGSAISNAAGAVGSAVSAIGSAVGSAVSSAASAVGSAIKGAASAVGNTAKAIGSGLAQMGGRILQAVRNNFFRPEGAKYLFGTTRFTLFGLSLAPGQGLMSLIENFVPTAHRLAAAHDALLGSLGHAGVPISDPVVFHALNFPTAPPAYLAAVTGAVVGTVADLARS